MLQIEPSSGQVIASDIQHSITAIDQAALSLSRLCASVLEVSSSEKLPVVAGQEALAKISAGLAMVIEGRALIAHATREIIKVQDRSNLKTVGFGCPPEFPAKPSGVSDEIRETMAR
ncbi:MAG: hypothetical protein ACEQR8_03490 [Cypionkella sp.]|jgi:hypothetical protein